jgi:WD40 repeat protein
MESSFRWRAAWWRWLAVGCALAGACARSRPASDPSGAASLDGPLFAAPTNGDGKPDRSAAYAQDLAADHPVMVWGIEGGVGPDAEASGADQAHEARAVKAAYPFSAASYTLEFWAEGPQGRILAAGGDVVVEHFSELRVKLGGQDLGTGVTLGEWSHVGVIVDGVEKRLRVTVNGVLRADKALEQVPELSGKAGFVVGPLTAGALDEVAVFEGALPVSRMLARTLVAEGARTPRPAPDALPLELVPQAGHATGVWSVGISPDGRYAATGGQDGTIYYWDLASGALLRSFLPDTRVPQTALVMDPAGRFVAGGSATIQVWDVETGKLVRRFPGGLHSLAFSPDGRTIAGYALDRDHAVVVYDLAHGTVRHRLTGHTGFGTALAFTPDGASLVSVGQDKRMLSWSLASGQKLEVPLAGLGSALAVHPGGELIAVGVIGGKGLATIYDRRGNEVATVAPEAFGSVSDLSFTPSGKELVVSTATAGVRFFDTETWEETRNIASALGARVAAVSPDERSLVFGSLETDGVVDLESDEQRLELSTGEATITHFEFTRDGSGVWLLTAGKQASLFDLSSLRQVGDVAGDVQTMLPNGQRVVVADGDSWQLRDLRSGEVLSTFEVPDALVALPGGTASSVTFSPRVIASADELFVFQPDFGAHSGKLERRRLPDGTLLGEIQLPGVTTMEGSGPMRLSPSGLVLAGGCVIDPKRDRTLHCLPITSLGGMALSPDGTRAAALVAERGLTMLDVRSGRELWRQGKSDVVLAITFSPDGGRVATYDVSDQSLKIMDAASGRLLTRLQTKIPGMASIAFHPSGEIVGVAGENGTLELRNLRSQKTLRLIKKGHEWLVTDEQGNFAGSRDAHRAALAVRGLEAFNIDQFALLKNRPDLLLGGLPGASPDAIAFYRSRADQRLKRHDLALHQLKSSSRPPEARVVSARRDDQGLHLTADLTDDSGLARYQIYVNGVPVNDKGFAAQGRRARVEQVVELTPGMNRIELSAVDSEGLESQRTLTEVETKSRSPGRLYYLGFGVSQYRDPRLNLGYAHKDALDLAEALGKLGSYASVHTRTFVDAEVTPGAVDQALKWVAAIRPEDTLVLFAAGHGLYDRTQAGNYYYVAHGVDLKRLSQTAIPFERFEQLLTAARARRKIFLLDTCESGEADDAQGQAGAAQGAKQRARSIRGLRLEPGVAVTPRPWVSDRDNFIFRNLQRRSGAIVFASSRASERSYEDSDVENGYFTDAILAALAGGADRDRDGELGIGELEQAVIEAVKARSNGLQNPVIDRENMHQGFGLRL